MSVSLGQFQALNIAEGRGRHSDKDFAKFLTQVRGSLLETVSGFHLAEQLAFVEKNQTYEFYQKAYFLNAKLTAFIQTLQKSH